MVGGVHEAMDGVVAHSRDSPTGETGGLCEQGVRGSRLCSNKTRHVGFTVGCVYGCA